MLLSLLIYVVLVPGLVTLVAALALTRPWDEAVASRTAAIGPALALGLLVTTIAQVGMPDLLPVNANDRLPHIALLAAVICALAAQVPSAAAHWGGRALVAAIAAWLTIGPLASLEGFERMLYIAVGAAGLLAYWGATRRALTGEHRLVGAALGVLLIGSAAAAIGASGSARLAEVAGSLASSVGALFVVLLVFARTPTLEHGAGVVAMLAGGAAILGHAFSQLPLVSLILLGLAPAAFVAARGALAGRLSDGLAAAVRLIVALAFLAAAAGLAAAPPSGGDQESGYPTSSDTPDDPAGDYNYAY